MARSRTKNVLKNVWVGIICRVINLIMGFVSRTVFISILGIEYLGVNGLFTNVLTILSFAELGIGNAIIFSMYKPLAENDEQKLASLMQFYKKTYTIIGIVVAVIGVAVVPFLPYLINGTTSIAEDLTVIYLLFLANTAVSYFFVYKKSIITADQKNYLVVGLGEIICIARIIVQLIVLYFTHNFILYLVLQIAFTAIDNIVLSIIADKIYPYIKQKAQPLSKEETKTIFVNVFSLVVYKIGSVILNGTDNILVSSLIDVASVGLVSNYVYLHTACNSILSVILNAFTASIGNLNAEEDSEKKHNVFNKVFLLSVWLYGFAAVGLAVVSPAFISAWIGEQYLLDRLTVFAIMLGFYVPQAHFAAYTYRTTTGLFTKGKWAPLLAAIINIVLSILLCQWIGIAGIFLATPIARMLTTGIVDPILIYKHVFKRNPLEYYVKYVMYLLLVIALGMLCNLCISFITVSGWLGVILQILVVTIVFNVAMLIVFGRTQMVKEVFTTLKKFLKKKKA